MSEQQKVSFPSVPVKQWWALRDKFRQSIPATVTPGYLAAALGMQESSARSNNAVYLIAFGIIDSNGKPQERAKQWRDDTAYPEVCAQIREEIYPRELLDALPPPNPDRAAVDRWFSNKTGVGIAAAQRMTAVYLMLCEADVTQRQESNKANTTKNVKPVAKKASSNNSKPNSKAVQHNNHTNEAITPPPLPQDDMVESKNSQHTPALHIDIQIHISPTASPEQIDQIFASMAKHLYGKS